MLFGMTWWASIYILFGLLIIVAEIEGLTEDEDEDEDEKTSDFLRFCGRLLYYVGLIVITVLSFQDETNNLIKWTVLSAAVICTPVSLWFIGAEFISFVKEPAGETDEKGEQTGVLFNALGHFAIIVFYGVGIAFAVSATQSVWSNFIHY